MQTPNHEEKRIWESHQCCIGIDEAGRGPIAGPLVVAGVVFPENYDSKDIYDSKKLSEKKREALYETIIHDALYFDIQIVSVEEIDRYNIYQATKRAMTKIALNADVTYVLTDAMPLEINKEVTSLIKGDQLSCSIAAASILAKVTRDRIMKEYDLQYPEYGFAKHKGYPTKQHLMALETYGVLDIHRKSYAPVANQLHQQLKLF
ncbi:MAG: ribonuclease HII [Erysipelotrichaceae bacterium]|nr:ribonuclease HII [Erysipelotrichaceae bacterium]